MNQLFFGNTWKKPYRQLYWGLLGLFFATITFFLISWGIGQEMTFPWETHVQRETITITIDTIKSGPFQLPLEVENYLLTESFRGGDLTVYKWPSYLFVTILAFIFTLAITCVTVLRRFWYLVGMGFVIAFLMSLQFGHLQLFGRFDKVALIGVFFLYLPLSYYYQSINKAILFTTRLIAFSLITAIVGLVIYFTAEVQYPFLHLIAYGYTAPVIITILFILMISHQILTGFMYIITANNDAFSKNSLTHFLTITGVYLLSLLVVVLNEIQYLHWELINIHPFALLLISSFIGIFLYRYREETYKHIYKFYPIGGFIYLMSGSICFFTIGYYLFSANEAIIEVFEDFILYAHFGYGLIFLIYVLANFLIPIIRNMQVIKVLYKPRNMPYFTYRFAGTIVVLAFLLASDYNIPIFHAMSSYYNAIGDLHLFTGQQKVAEVYYGRGKSFDYGNHRANYALGVMARNRGDNAKAAYHFSEAIRKRPSAQGYVNMGNIYLLSGKFFNGLFTIRDGLDKLPTSDPLKINLGLLYDRVKEPDSAFMIFNAARNQSLTKRSANVNILALCNKRKANHVYDPNSLTEEYVTENHTALISNGFALHTAGRQFWDRPMVIDTLLDVVTGHGLYNQSINSIYAPDSVYLSRLHGLALASENIAFRQQLLSAVALGYYYHQEVGKAYRLVDQLANNYPAKSGYYFYLSGLWALDQQAPLLAVDFFEKSHQRQYRKAKSALAIAIMEAGLADDAQDIWEELSLDADPPTRQMAEKALQMLTGSRLAQMNDAQKYWYWKYQVSKENEILTQEVIDVITDAHYKSQIFTDLTKYFLDRGDTSKVLMYAKQITNSDEISLANESYWLNMAKDDLTDKVDTAYHKVIFGKTIDKSQAAVLNYYQARHAIARNDTTTANELFEKTSANPFFEQGVIGKAKYLSDKGELTAAYNTLLNAMEINPYAINLRKQYILQCASMDFEKYGNYALEQFRSLVAGQQYRTFRKQYEEKLKATGHASAYFDNQ